MSPKVQGAIKSPASGESSQNQDLYTKLEGTEKRDHKWDHGWNLNRDLDRVLNAIESEEIQDGKHIVEQLQACKDALHQYKEEMKVTKKQLKEIKKMKKKAIDVAKRHTRQFHRMYFER